MLRLHGVNVNAIVCDGASENRAFIKLMADARARQYFRCKSEHVQVGMVIGVVQQGYIVNARSIDTGFDVVWLYLCALA